jgi:hypothetical protein
MPKLPSLLLCAWSVACALYSGAQVPEKRTLVTTVDVVAGNILEASKNPGGVELISGCDIPETKTFNANFENPYAALADAARKENHLTWTKSGSAYTVTIQLTASQSVTSVKLPAMQISATTLSEATDSLLQVSAVRDRVVGMKMTELAENFGFTSINERKTHLIDLPAGTLREDLNALAVAFGSAVWKLDQRECQNTRTFRISWIAK